MSDKNQVKSERCRKEKKFFFPYLSKVMDGMYNIVNDPEIFILETA